MSSIEPPLQARAASRARLAIGLAAALAAYALLAAGAARASTAVTYYAAPSAAGSGDCSASANACTLATALADAAAATGDAVTIQLAAGTYSPIAITGGLESTLTLDGAGAGTSEISGAGSAQTARFGASGFPLTLENLALIDGDATGNDGGNLEIETGAGAVTIEDAAITGGTSSLDGGGISVTGATLTIENSSISANATAGGEVGGGLMIFGGATVNVEDSTINDNTASGGGAGIDLQNTSTLNVYGSTIAANVGEALISTGNAFIYGTTISANSGGGIDLESHTVDLGADVLAGNGGEDCFFGTPTDEGYNYTDDATCASALTAPTSHVNDSAIGLGTLGANGGPTQTVPATAASAAYDVVPSTVTLTADPQTGSFCSSSDQRGVARTQGPAAACSAGAFQYAPPVATSLAPRPSLELGLPATVSGYGLADVSAVSVGATAATITAQSATQISFTIPLALALGSEPITLTNPDGSAQVAFNAVAAPGLSATTLAPAEYKVPYSQQLAVSGGAAPYSFALTSGALPGGLHLSSSGVVSGTPGKAGGAAFGVAITDANGVTTSGVIVSIVVATPVITVTSTSLTISGTTIAVALSCAAAPCAGGSVTLDQTVTKRVKGKPVVTSVLLASAPYTLAAGQSGTVEMALTSAGRHVLKHAKKHPPNEVLNATVAAGTTETETIRVR